MNKTMKPLVLSFSKVPTVILTMVILATLDTLKLLGLKIDEALLIEPEKVDEIYINWNKSDSLDVSGHKKEAGETEERKRKNRNILFGSRGYDLFEGESLASILDFIEAAYDSLRPKSPEYTFELSGTVKVIVTDNDVQMDYTELAKKALEQGKQLQKEKFPQQR